MTLTTKIGLYSVLPVFAYSFYLNLYYKLVECISLNKESLIKNNE